MPTRSIGTASVRAAQCGSIHGGYEPKLVQRDAPAVTVMRELAAQYPRYGDRRIQVFMGRRGHAMSPDRAHRLWRLHRLQVPKKKPRRRVASSRPRPLPATAVGHVWAYDFVFDACANMVSN